jgi:hypothetical protein
VNLSLLINPDGARQRIRQLIQVGWLPRDHTLEVWRGASVGQRCDGCGVPIEVNDRMCLLCGEDWKLFRFHLNCFQIWDSERNAEADVEQTA